MHSTVIRLAPVAAGNGRLAPSFVDAGNQGVTDETGGVSIWSATRSSEEFVVVTLGDATPAHDTARPGDDNGPPPSTGGPADAAASVVTGFRRRNYLPAARGSELASITPTHYKNLCCSKANPFNGVMEGLTNEGQAWVTRHAPSGMEMVSFSTDSVQLIPKYAVKMLYTDAIKKRHDRRASAMTCNCRAGCRDRRCACRKREAACSSRCKCIACVRTT